MKSHFVFTKTERNGIFLLIILIIAAQLVYWFWPFNFQAKPSKSNWGLIEDKQKIIDSIKSIAVDENKPKLYPFNPNYITDYKGYTLGMSNEEIDRLLAYRKSGKWINSKADFKQVTKVSDSLLATFSHLFKFPEWVTNPKKKSRGFKTQTKTYSQKTDLNSATSQDLQKVYGIGPYYAKRIIAYREKLGGFTNAIQLKDVYGLEPDVIKNILKDFAVKTPKQINKVNINTCRVTDLSELPNLDYEIARQILKFRESNGSFTDLNQLKSIEGFPIEKLDRIQLYLTLQ